MKYSIAGNYRMVLFAILFVSCSDNGKPTQGPVISADEVTDVDVFDVGNSNNGQDLRVTFDKAPDESLIREYRVFVVKSPDASTINLTTANNLDSLLYLRAPKTGSDVSIELTANSTDIDGHPIVNGVAYRALVLSVADGINATINALSAPSKSITLAVPVAGTTVIQLVDDVTNFGNGQDLQVTFTKAVNENAIGEYWVIVTKSASASSFDLNAANGLDEGTYSRVPKEGIDITTTLSSTAKDIDAEFITEGVAYKVFVLSVADGIVAGINALSQPSDEITLAVTTVKITYMGNDGVLIADQDNQVLIDALHTNHSSWITIPATEHDKVIAAQAPYNQIDIAMSTHNHGDHSTSTNINSFLGSSSGTKFIGPPQVVSGLQNPSQIININPPFRTKLDTTVNGVLVEVLHLKHFDQFGNDFSTVENFGYLVHIGGLKILHLGDVEYTVENFQNFNLASESIDIVLIPTFNTLISTTNRDLIMSQVNPQHVIALHFQSALVASEATQVFNLFTNVTLFTEGLQFLRY